jgi:hypothetical protein
LKVGINDSVIDVVDINQFELRYKIKVHIVDFFPHPAVSAGAERSVYEIFEGIITTFYRERLSIASSIRLIDVQDRTLDKIRFGGDGFYMDLMYKRRRITLEEEIHSSDYEGKS